MKQEPSEIFKVLSVGSRVKIIELLKESSPLGPKDIARKIGITTAAVSQHLKILKQAGLVRSERKGYWIPYSIDEKAMNKCRKIVSDVCACGCHDGEVIRKGEAERSDLELLMSYEKELRNELRKVRRRVIELKPER